MNSIYKAVDLIKGFEGFESEAYKCPANIITIGYGITVYPDGSKVKIGDNCTEQQASEWLKERVQKDFNLIRPKLLIAPNENQMAAFLSLAYNIGLGNFFLSTPFKSFNKGDFNHAAGGFLLWCKITVDGEKIISKGLSERRKKERELFLTPII